jgi:LysM domain-containing protein
MPDPIDPNGRRIDNDNQGQTGDFSAQIDAVTQLLARKGQQVDPNVFWVAVEKGDCLWDIAEEYGVDPLQLIKDNQQFAKNPDLIFADQVVMVRLSPGTDPVNSGKQFSLEVNSMIESAKNSPPSSVDVQWGGVESRIDAYMDLPGGRSEAAMNELLKNVTDPRARGYIFENYLQNADDKGAAYADLKKRYPDAVSAIDSAYRSVTGQEPPK